MSLIKNDFHKNININKSAIYHFLDGYLDPNIGNTKQISINYLKNILNDQEQNIEILDINLVNYMTMECELIFHNSKSTSIIKYTGFNLCKILESLSNLSSNESFITNIDLDHENKSLKLLNHFKYCIVPVYHDKHATSILFFQHSNKQYMMTINSGLGLEIHDNIINGNSDRFYEPFKGYQIYDNFITDTVSCLSTIFKIISIGDFYDILKMNYHLKYELITDNSVDKVILLDSLLLLYNNIISILPNKSTLNSDLFDINIEIIKKKDTTNITNINNITKIKKQLEKFDSKIDKFVVTTKKLPEYYIIKGDDIKITFPYLYYDFFKNVMEELNFVKFDYKQIGLDDLSIFGINNYSLFKNPEDKINDNIIKKLILHYHKPSNKLYILPQQSGSCTWFSKYWPVVLYNVLISKNSEQYIETIKQINSKSYQIVKSLFSKESFINEYLKNKSLFVTMKNCCNKLCDLGVLDIDILKEQIDFIYNIEIPINYTEQTLSLKNNNLLTNIIDFKNIYLPNPKKIIEFIITNFNKNKTKYQNSFLLFVFIVYVSKKLLFKSNLIGFSSKSIYDFINGLSFGKSKSSGKSVVLKNIKIDPELETLDNYILQWNSVNSFKIPLDSISIKPSYYLDYIDVVLYFFNFIKNINLNSALNLKNEEINFDINSIDIDGFIKYLHQFKLLACILTQIYKTLNNSNYINKSIKLTENLGQFIYQNLISNMINSIHPINYISSTNENFTIIDLCKFTKFINPCIFDLSSSSNKKVDSTNTNYKSQLNVYTINIDNYFNIKKLILDNPIYLTKLFTNINQTMFIKLNIDEIFNNEIIRNNFLKIYGKIFWEKINNDLNKTFDNLRDIIPILQLLFNKRIATYDVKDSDSDLLFLNFKTNIYSFLDSYNILKEIALTKNLDLFISEIIKNKDVLFDPLTKLKTLLIEKIGNIEIKNDVITIEQKSFNLINLENKDTYCLISNLFVHDNEYTYFLLEKNDVTHKILYIVNDKEQLKFLVNFVDYDSKEKKIKIDKIFYNNYPVIKYNEINLPFKNIIPFNCPHLIWNNKTNYMVTFFANNNFSYKNINDPESDLNLLGPVTIDTKSYTFEISNISNLLSDNSDLDLFQNILLNYGSNNWNILYINKFESTSEESNENNGYYYNYKTYQLYFNKKELFKNKIRVNEAYSFDNIQLMNTVSENNIIKIKYINTDLKLNGETKVIKSIEKLLYKISNCEINVLNKNSFKSKITRIISVLDENIKDYTLQLVQTDNLNKLFNDNQNLYFNYINCNKYKNICIKLLELVDKNDDALFCSQIKIYSDILNSRQYEYKYIFEVIFEILSGITITKEQFERYQEIINNFIKWNDLIFRKKYDEYDTPILKTNNIDNLIDVKFDNLKGGGCKEQTFINYFEETKPKLSYPLHHFMMGKGKSAVITPLLALHFSIIYGKIVYIIVPTHLLKQTKETINKYVKIFNIQNNIKIVSDIEIKKLFLAGEFENRINNNNIIFLIDEFDSIINPLKSNYNEIIDKNISVSNLYKILKEIVIKIKNQGIRCVTMSDIDETNYKLLGFSESNLKLIIQDVNNIIEQIKNNTFKENINWGIHVENCYAIPYLNKDKPLLDSNFSSSVLTVFLTLYYFIILKNYTADKFIVNFLIKYDLMNKIFNIDVLPFNINEELINELLKSNPIIKFDDIFDNIFNNILLAEFQYNCSFIDLININNIYKIGYSGTMNVNLPKLNSLTVFNNINVDYDEKVNINYAIENATIITNNEVNRSLATIKLYENFFKINILNYNAIIDIVGLFKNIPNIDFAIELYKYFKPKKETTIIFLDEKDNKFTIIDGKVEPYNSNINYTNPFFYYSQTHIVGVDIKQDNYPVLKGLCIVDNLSSYSETAQAMFRLRKLNMGHSIDFFVIENHPISSSELLYIFNKNEENHFNQKKDHMIYQTIKSEIRKYRTTDKCFNDIYKEKVKHYYLFEIPNSSNTDEFFEGILTLDEIKKLKLEDEFLKINTNNKLLSLVYNVNSFIYEQQFQQETEKIKKVNVIIQNEIQSSITIGQLNFGFENIDFTYENILKLSIEIDKDFRFLPNLFCNPNYYNYYQNETGIYFVWIEENNFILIIPGYMLGYFINIRPIFDHYLTIINYNIFKSIEFLETIKTISFFGIFNKNIKTTIDCAIIHPVLLLISTIIINKIKNKNEKIQAIYDCFINMYVEKSKPGKSGDIVIYKTNNNYNKMIDSYIKSKITKSMYDQSIKRLISDYEYNINDLDNNKRLYLKYLKYKNKYLQLKKLAL